MFLCCPTSLPSSEYFHLSLSQAIDSSIAIVKMNEQPASSGAAMQRASDRFRALITFLRMKIYCYVPGLLKENEEEMHDNSMGSVGIITEEFQCSVAAISQFLSSVLMFCLAHSASILEMAEGMAIKHVVFPAKNPGLMSWATWSSTKWAGYVGLYTSFLIWALLALGHTSWLILQMMFL
jgi:hypothetical protein